MESSARLARPRASPPQLSGLDSRRDYGVWSPTCCCAPLTRGRISVWATDCCTARGCSLYFSPFEAASHTFKTNSGSWWQRVRCRLQWVKSLNGLLQIPGWFCSERLGEPSRWCRKMHQGGFSHTGHETAAIYPGSQQCHRGSVDKGN